MPSYDDVCEALEQQSPEVSRGKMFGMPCIKAGSKAIAGLYEGDMVFKLPDEAARERALALGGAHLFEPMQGRPMREWVQVPEAHADQWLALGQAALESKRG
jgi:hypothetical protein